MLAVPFFYMGNLIDEYFNPVRVQTGGYDLVNEEIVRLSEMGAGTLSPHKRKHKGIHLSAEQYNDYVTLINNSYKVNENINLQPGDSLYSVSNALLPSLQREITSSSYQNEVDDDKKYQRISNIVADHREAGIEILMKNYPVLENMILQETNN